MRLEDHSPSRRCHKGPRIDRRVDAHPVRPATIELDPRRELSTLGPQGSLIGIELAVADDQETPDSVHESRVTELRYRLVAIKDTVEIGIGDARIEFAPECIPLPIPVDVFVSIREAVTVGIPILRVGLGQVNTAVPIRVLKNIEEAVKI
jgi:hypothetical protein